MFVSSPTSIYTLARVFFSKIHTANKYVVLDDLSKYSKSSFQTRNSVRVSGAKKTDILSIPIIKDSTKESF